MILNDNESRENEHPEDDISLSVGENVLYQDTDGYGSIWPGKVITVRHSISGDIVVFNNRIPYVHYVPNVLVGKVPGTVIKIR